MSSNQRALLYTVGMIRGALAGLVILGASAAAAADVVVLKGPDAAAWAPALEALRRGAPGHSIRELDLSGDRAEAERVVTELKSKVAVLVGVGPLAALAARAAAPDLPLVYCGVSDPAALGLKAANIGGVTTTVPAKNQLAAFRMVNPRGIRVGLLYDPAVSSGTVEEARKAAALLRLILVEKPIASEKDIPPAVRGLVEGSEAADAVWLLPDPVVSGSQARRFVLETCLKAGKPVYASASGLVTEGALVSSGPDLASVGEQLAMMVNAFAAGEKGTPMLQVPRAELIINSKIADKLKVVIPEAVLKSASKVL